MTPYAKERFLIRFGDNDFGNTMLAFAKIVVLHMYPPRFLTKARVAQLWNMLAPGLYLLVQNQGRYRDTPDDLAHTTQYLQITPDKVYLDSEATDYIDNHQHGWNSEWVLVDLEAGTGTIV